MLITNYKGTRQYDFMSQAPRMGTIIFLHKVKYSQPLIVLQQVELWGRERN